MSQAGSNLFAISDFTLHWNPKLEAPAWVQLRAKKSGPPQLMSEVGFLCSSSHPCELLTMASSQKSNTRSASRSTAAWARASEGDAALGKPVAVQDANASLDLPIAVVDTGEEMSPTFSPGPAGDVVDLTPELAEKIRAETDQVQRAEATGLRLPRPVSPPVEQALPPVEREDVGNAPMPSYLQLANRVQPPQPLSPGRLHPDVSEDHLQPPRPESSSHVWEP